jgi:hypothetical protein
MPCSWWQMSRVAVLCCAWIRWCRCPYNSRLLSVWCRCPFLDCSSSWLSHIPIIPVTEMSWAVHCVFCAYHVTYCAYHVTYCASHDRVSLVLLIACVVNCLCCRDIYPLSCMCWDAFLGRRFVLLCMPWQNIPLVVYRWAVAVSRDIYEMRCSMDWMMDMKKYERSKRVNGIMNGSIEWRMNRGSRLMIGSIGCKV